MEDNNLLEEKLGSLIKNKGPILDKIRKRYPSHKKLIQDIKELYSKLLKESELFRNFVNNKTPETGFLILHPELGDMSYFNKPSIFKKMNKDILKLGFFALILENYFNILIGLRRSGNSIITSLINKFPDYELFKISGNSIKVEDVYKIKEFYETAIKLGAVWGEFEIYNDDYGFPRKEFTPGSEIQISELFGKMNSVTPTLIKYTSKSEKRLLICIPPNLDPTTFWKEYGNKLSQIHSDFYKKKFRGRPKSKDKKREMLSAVLAPYKGKRYSINKLCQLASEKASDTLKLSPKTIRRHFLKEIKQIKEAKIS